MVKTDSLARRPGRRVDSTHHAHVAIDRCYPLVGACLEEFAGDELLDSKNDTVFAPYADRSSSIFHSLYGIFDLAHSR